MFQIFNRQFWFMYYCDFPIELWGMLSDVTAIGVRWIYIPWELIMHIYSIISKAFLNSPTYLAGATITSGEDWALQALP